MLYLNVLQLIWHYFLLPFYYNLLHSYCNLLLLLFFTAVYYFLLQVTTFLPQVTTSVIKILKKKNLPKITTIYCNLLQWYCNLQQQFTAFSCTAILFFVVSTSKYRLFSTSIYYNLLHSYCNILPLLFFTAVYCKLPRFTAIYRPSGTTV